MSDSVRNKVKQLMFLDQLNCDSDRHLVLAVWSQYGLTLNRKQRMAFLDAPSAEVITRRRREFSKDFPASEAVLERRHKNYRDMTEEYSDHSWLKKLVGRKS